MRQNVEAFEVLLDRFVAPIVGMREFKKRVASFESHEKLFTACDEAFIYLVLENNYDRWMDMFERTRQATDNGERLGKNPWEVTSLVKTKYTEGGQMLPDEERRTGRGDWQQSKGWSDAGIERYNELFRAVKSNRRKYKKTMADWFARKKRESSDKVAMNGRVVETVKVVCATDLFGDEVESSDAGSCSEDSEDSNDDVNAQHNSVDLDCELGSDA